MDPHDKPITGRRTRPRAQSSNAMPVHDNPSQTSTVTTLEDRDSKRRKVGDLDSGSSESDVTAGLSEKNRDKLPLPTTQDQQAKASGNHNETQIDPNVPSSPSVPQSPFSTSDSSLNAKSSQLADNVTSPSASAAATPTLVSHLEDPLFSPRARAQELISRVSLELEQDNARLPRMGYVDPSPISSLFNDMPSSTLRAEPSTEPPSDQLESAIGVSSSAPPPFEESQPPTPQNPQPSPSPIQRIPTGTSLIVQGLVQTVARPRSSNPFNRRASSSMSTSGSRSHSNIPTDHNSGQTPVFGNRRSAGRTAGGISQQNDVVEDDDGDMPSFEEQASLIGGLLSMATTATARSLLSTTSDPNASHSTTRSSSSLSDPGRTNSLHEPYLQPLAQPSGRLPSRFASVVDGIQRRLNALRNATSSTPSSSSRSHVVPPQSSGTDTSRAPSGTSSQEEGIERVLRRFMTEAFERQDRSRESGSARTRSPFMGERPETLEENDADGTSVQPDQESFESFLSGLQPSLVEALMEFNNNSSERETGEIRSEAAESETSTPATENQTNAEGTESIANNSANNTDVPVLEDQVEGGRRMNWMRVHRFSPRLAPASRANGASLQGTGNPSASISTPNATNEGDSRMGSAHVSGSGPNDQGNNLSGGSIESNTSRERTVVPLIMVGVRSVRAQDIPGIFASTAANGGQPSATAAAQRPTTSNSNSSSARQSRQDIRADRSRSFVNTPANTTRPRPGPYASSLPARLLRRRSSQTTTTSTASEGGEDAVMSSEPSRSQFTNSHTRPSGFALLRRALSGIIGNGLASSSPTSSQSTEPSTESSGEAVPVETTATTSDSSSDSTDSADGTEVRRSNSFILWVIGGLYAPDHPILTAPGLFTGHLDHDDLWALAELLGQAKPPTATETEINSSGLTIIHGSDIASLVKTGHIHLNTSDRCAVCLEDYASEVECRIMSCKHVFHKECIDKWLNVGRNACPACRTKGVKVKADEQEASATNPTLSEGTVSLDT